MLAKQKEQDLTEVFRGPVMMVALGIIIIASAFTFADTVGPDEDDRPDESPIFGSAITDIINEFVYYLKWGMYLAIIAGSIMVGATLIIRPTTHGR